MKKKLLCTFLGLGALTTPCLGVTSCSKGEQETPLEKKYNDYCEKYQAGYIKTMKATEVYQDYYKWPDVYCQCPAEAVVLSCYGPGWVEWGTEFHNGKSDEYVKSLPPRRVEIGVPNPLAPKDFSKYISRANLEFGMWDFDYLDAAVASATAGIPLTVYHGYEVNEVEMMSVINESLRQNDILKMPKDDFRKLDFSNLKGKTITDLSWCATTFEESFAKGWADDDKDDINVPIYELHLPADVRCIYVSYSRQKYFDGIYLAWPHEYQLLTERKLKFTVKDTWLEPRYDEEGKDWGNLLHIECDVTRPEE